jgi:hypothetical protein
VAGSVRPNSLKVFCFECECLMRQGRAGLSSRIWNLSLQTGSEGPTLIS